MILPTQSAADTVRTPDVGNNTGGGLVVLMLRATRGATLIAPADHWLIAVVTGRAHAAALP